MILHAVDSLDASTGGPARTVPQLCKSLTGFHKISLFSDFKYKGLSSFGDIECINSSDPKSVRALLEGSLGNDIKIVHDHGLWLPSNIRVYKYAKKKSLPLIVSPRGMLEPWSLKAKWLKKKFAWQLYQKRILKYATVIHATAELEAESLRRLGFKQPIAVIPNGVKFPEYFPERNNNKIKTLLFLSRIHPKKGIENLLDAWSIVKNKTWQLKIIGPSNHKYLLELKDKALSLDLKNIIFRGVLTIRINGRSTQMRTCLCCLPIAKILGLWWLKQ